MTSAPASFASIPVNQFLGFRLVGCDRDSAAISFRPASVHTQEYGVVHGGILAALADTAAVYSVLPSLGERERMTSIEFKINFLAGALPERGDVVARACVKRRGRTIAVVQVDVHQSETQVATGLFTYIILTRSTARRAAPMPA